MGLSNTVTKQLSAGKSIYLRDHLSYASDVPLYIHSSFTSHLNPYLENLCDDVTKETKL